MEEFLKDYVKMYAESNDINLTKNQILQIATDLMYEDEIWDTLDSYINDFIEDMD